MTLRWMRLGFLCFLCLNFAFATNLLLFQPTEGRLASKRTLPPRTIAEKPAEIATGSVVVLNAGAASAAVKIDAGRAASNSAAGAEVVKAIQRELQARGYETGTADGMPGLVTRAAVMAYESDHALPLTGVPSDALLQAILLGAPQDGRKSAAAKSAPGPEAEQVIRTVQQSLTTLGYHPGAIDGRLGEQTVRTIAEFEGDQNLPVTGRISGQLVARLARLAGQGRLADSR